MAAAAGAGLASCLRQYSSGCSFLVVVRLQVDKLEHHSISGRQPTGDHWCHLKLHLLLQEAHDLPLTCSPGS